MAHRILAGTVAALGLLVVAPAMAGNGQGQNGQGQNGQGNGPRSISAPEIDVATGLKGGALLLLALALVAESRRRRSR